MKLFLDQSLSNTGYAYFTEEGKIHTGTIKGRGKYRMMNMSDDIGDLMEDLQVTEVVLESVTYRKGMGKTGLILSELAGAIRYVAHKKGIAVEVSNQGKLNKFGQRKDARLHYLKKHYSEPERWDNGFPRTEHAAESAMHLILS